MLFLSVPAGQPKNAEVTWRSLYACQNGWRGLQPGCFERLDFPSSSERGMWMDGFPHHCILDSRDLSWSALAGGASELLVIVEWTSVLVSLRDWLILLSSGSFCDMPVADKLLWPAGI